MKIATGRPEDPVRGVFSLFWRCKMCEAKVYLSEDGEEQKIMEDVVLMQPEPESNAYLLVNILGEQKLVQGHIEKIDFLRHVVYLSATQ
jgi:predicted RNA-binding protein